MRIIPAIDIINGKCVRLTRGDYSTVKTYYDNPVDVAKAFEDANVKYLHLVDLDGAKSDGIINYEIISKIASSTSLEIDFGGGLKSNKDVAVAFENGAHKVTIGSIAYRKPEIACELLQMYGKQKIILGADCLERKIATGGWLDQSDVDVITFIEQYAKVGVEAVICTDISKDGMMEGPAIELYKDILSCKNVKLIASGGIRSVNDIDLLKKIGCEGAIIGKAIYEGKITMKQLQELC